MTEQHAVRARRSSKKRQTKPIKIGHKSIALKELTSDGFGPVYAKQTQFRVIEAASLEGWRCWKPARREAWPTLDRAAQTGAEWDRQTRKLDNACPAGAAGRVAGGEGRVADGGCRADDEYGVSLGGCVVGNSSEPMAQAHPDVPAEEDQEPKIAPNKANLETTQASLPQKFESGLTSPAGRKQSQLLRGGRNQARRCRTCTVPFTSSTIRDIMRGGQGCRLICHCQGSSRPRAGK